jgi:hypothetical protein
MGTPAASIQLAPGAGHGGEGDASLQGPAQEDVLSAQPKPTNAKTTNPEIAIFAAVPRDSGLVMTRPKPEKRKNFKERAKAKFAKKDSKEKTAEDGTTPMTATAKSEAEAKAKAERKAEVKVAAKAAKAERKKNRSAGKRAAAKAA